MPETTTTPVKKKSILKSRTFWFNILSVAAMSSGMIPLAPQTAAVIAGVINVGLRVVTGEPVVVWPKKD